MELTTNCMLKILVNHICIIYLNIILFTPANTYVRRPATKITPAFSKSITGYLYGVHEIIVCVSFQSFRDVSLSCPFILPHSCSYSCISCQARWDWKRLKSPSGRISPLKLVLGKGPDSEHFKRPLWVKNLGKTLPRIAFLGPGPEKGPRAHGGLSQYPLFSQWL